MSYDASSITVLEGLEAVRKRPGMYIGSTGERGLHHLVYEIVDNSVDEALAGHADRIHVTLLADGGVRVEDNGRGIPVDRHKIEKRPAVEVVLTTLHAGGKFDGKSYAVSGGLHGVGAAVVNALSSRFDVEIHRDGFTWTQTYAEGGTPQAPLHQGAPTKRTGTTITFWADATIFEETHYSFETLTRRLQEMAFLNAGLSITIRDERDETPIEVVYHYKGGIEDFVKYLNNSKVPIHKTVCSFSAETEGMALDIAMQWNETYSESVYTFANTINTHEGGTHEEGFRAALTGIVNKYAVDKKLIKEKDNKLTGDDIREGLAAIISVKLANPQFEGQTKTKLGNTEAKSFVQKACNDWITDWFERNPGDARNVISKALQASQARQAARKARDLARGRKGLLESGGLPGKLADCQSNNPVECEVYVVEGDSAGGCFTGDTLVALVDGTSRSLRDLAADWAMGVSHFGYATDGAGDVVVVPLDEPRLTKRAARLVEVVLDNGQKLRCTPDHLFRLRDGSYRRADALVSGDSLMPLYRRLTERGQNPGPGYEQVWANGRSRWEHTHHLADQWNLSAGLAHWSQGPVRHHADFNKGNNDPRNLVRMSQQGHIELHAAQAHRTLGPLWSDPEYRARKIAQLSESAKRQWQDPAYRERMTQRARELRTDPQVNDAIAAGFRAWLDSLDDPAREAIRQRLDEAQRVYWSDPQHRAEASRRQTERMSDADLVHLLRDAAVAQWDDEELRQWRRAATEEQWKEPGRREAHSAAVRRWWVANPDHAEKIRAGLARSWADPAFREKVATGLARWRASTSRADKGALILEGKRRQALRLMGKCADGATCEAEVIDRYERARLTEHPKLLKVDTLIDMFGGYVPDMIEAAQNHNHKVVSVRALDMVEDVYDLTVEGHHNFALEAGVFVHNSAKGGRNPMFQAILPIRGKIINVEKARIDKVLKNTEVQSLIQALGTGIHDDFDIDKLRYHKIVLMADADVDGQHITTLLLTLLFRFMKPLIESGHVYLAQPPLYKIKWNRPHDPEYAYSDRERDAVVLAGQEAGKRITKEEAIQRYKGLGEMNAAELWDTTMDPAHRILRQVTLDDAATADELFSVLMGEDVVARRDFIVRNARDVRFLDF